MRIPRACVCTGRQEDVLSDTDDEDVPDVQLDVPHPMSLADVAKVFGSISDCFLVTDRQSDGVPHGRSGGGGGGGWKRAQLTGPLISYNGLWRQRQPEFFSALKISSIIFSAKYMANDDFSKTPRRADSTNLIFIFFCRILGPGHLRGPGVSLGRILGGPPPPS